MFFGIVDIDNTSQKQWRLVVFRVPEAQIRERIVIGKHLAAIIRFKADVGQFSSPTLIFSHEHATLA